MPSSKPEKSVAKVAAQEDDQPKLTVVEASAKVIASVQKIIQFRNRPMVQMDQPFPHFIPLSKELFKRLAYPVLGGVSRSRINDVYDFVENISPDFTDHEDLMLFGLEDYSDGAYVDNGFYAEGAETRVWDAHRLEFVDTPGDQAVWRSPYAVKQPTQKIPFIMSLAGNDEGLYDDIMQSLAPMVMSKKPDGVIWWVGDGANGKSTLMDAVYRIFPGQLSSLTVKALADGRDTPRLNGTLANIVKESSEGRVEDTEIYKAVGTHENFTVHKFHSQDSVTIRGNLHHVFSANSIPTFNDKGFSARRRTFIVPFTQTFESDPLFEQKTFTPQMFGELIFEMCRYAKQLKDQGYRYKWSAQTLSAKLEYDTDANNAEEYAREIIKMGVVAFDSFTPIKMDYENWCADQGYVPLGITNLRRALGALGFERLTVRLTADHTRKMYRLPIASHPGELQQLSMGRPGIYTIPGFTPPDDDVPAVPSFTKPAEPDEPAVDNEPEDDPAEKRTSILNGRW